MAIESAYVLSRSLKEQADIRSALRRYESQRHARTACLAAAAETLLTSISGALTPDERSRQDKRIVAAHDTLDEPAFQFAWNAGRANRKSNTAPMRSDNPISCVYFNCPTI